MDNTKDSVTDVMNQSRAASGERGGGRKKNSRLIAFSSRTQRKVSLLLGKGEPLGAPCSQPPSADGTSMAHRFPCPCRPVPMHKPPFTERASPQLLAPALQRC